MFAKIKLYITAGIALVIISLMVFIGFQYVRIVALEKNVGDLKIENKRAWKEYDFAQKKIEIQNQFSNSTTTINEITNEIIFSPTGAHVCVLKVGVTPLGTQECKMKCSKCEKDFDIKDVAEDAMEREMNNLYFECPECDTPLVMTYTLQED